MEVVAEGVERDTVCEELARMGADCAQGFYFSRPLPIDGVRQWLRQRAQRICWPPPTGRPRHSGTP